MMSRVVPQPVWDVWPVEDMPHVPAGRRRWIAALTSVFGRPRSHHAPVLIEPGKWRLSNWNRAHTFEPRSIYAPATIDELLAVVEMCGRSGRKLKPAASLHSWSACAVTDDVSLQMGCLNQVLKTDTAARTVTVQAGMRLRDLYTHLERSGLALPCLPNVDTIQVGGAIANATHGTCIRCGSMCSLVSELQIECSRFIAAKRELDAANIFSNPFSDRICGSTHHESV